MSEFVRPNQAARITREIEYLQSILARTRLRPDDPDYSDEDRDELMREIERLEGKYEL